MDCLNKCSLENAGEMVRASGPLVAGVAFGADQRGA